MKTSRRTPPDGGADPQRVLDLLAATPREIARLVLGYSGADLERPPAPDAWSARDIVAHLRACADVWGECIERMLAKDHPTIRHVSPRGWMTKSGYMKQSLAVSLAAFTKERATLVKRLGGRDTAVWARDARITGKTPGATATVLEYAARMAEHEVGHLGQLRRTLEGVR